jgi:cellulose synthase/poly-beta-1,6-N-acetylglucosamine synthase-like glycosyltransferase
LHPLASIVIPARNPDPYIFRQLMNSLLSQTYPDIEIIFVDSSDSTPPVLKEYMDRLIYVKQRRKNVSGVRQDGLDAASGSILLGIDCDCVPPENWAETMIRRLDRDRGYTIVMGKSIPYGQDRLSFIVQENFERWVDYIGLNLDGEKLLITLDTKNYGVFTDVARQIGFDTEMSAAEDTDFAFRALAAGNRIVYCPDAPVRHCHRQNFKGLLRQKMWHGFGYGQFVTKNGVDHYTHRPMRLLCQACLMVLIFPLTLAYLFLCFFREGPDSVRSKIASAFEKTSFCWGMIWGIYRTGGRAALWQRVKNDFLGLSSRFKVTIIQ